VTTRNRIFNASNPYQRPDKHRRVLCVCSAGLLRSPTAAVVLASEPFNYNTRAAGITTEYALVPVDDVLLEWADEIVCMESWMAQELEGRTNKPIYSLNIPDNFEYRDPELMELIKERYLKEACS